MSPDRPTYRPPWRFNSPNMLPWLAISILCSVAIGAGLGALMADLGVVGRQAITIGVIAFVPGLITGQIAKVMKLPHPELMSVGSLLTGLAAGYAFICLRITGLWSYEIFFWSPLQIIEYWPRDANELQQVNWITNETRAGTDLDVSMLQLQMGIAMALSVVGNPIVAYVRGLWMPPFCSQCNHWLDTPSIVLVYEYQASVSRVAYQLERGQWQSLNDLNPRSNPSDNWLELRVHQCPTCGGDGYASFYEMRDMNLGDDHQVRYRALGNRPIHADIIRQVRDAYESKVRHDTSGA